MLELLEKALDASAMRAQVLTQNLANVSTPGYQRQDVPFFDLMKQLLATGHAALRSEPDTNASARSDGNSVDMEKELAAVSENALLYQTIVQVASGRLSQLKHAITEGRA